MPDVELQKHLKDLKSWKPSNPGHFVFVPKGSNDGALYVGKAKPSGAVISDLQIKAKSTAQPIKGQCFVDNEEYVFESDEFNPDKDDMKSAHLLKLVKREGVSVTKLIARAPANGAPKQGGQQPVQSREDYDERYKTVAAIYDRACQQNPNLKGGLDALKNGVDTAGSQDVASVELEKLFVAAQKVLDDMRDQYDAQAKAVLEAYQMAAKLDPSQKGALDKVAENMAKEVRADDYRTALEDLTLLNDLAKNILKAGGDTKPFEDCNKKIKETIALISAFAKDHPEASAPTKQATDLLKQATAKRDSKDYPEALALCEQIRLALDAKGKEAPKKEPTLSKAQEKEKAKKERLEATEAAQDLNIALIGEFLPGQFERIMNEHRHAKKGEEKVFDGFRWVDDVFDTITDPAKRRVKLKDIGAAVDAARLRQKTMQDSIKNFAGSHSPLSDEDLQAIEVAQDFMWNMTKHIPDSFLSTKGISERANTLDDLAGLKEDERQDRIKQARDLPKSVQDSEKEVFLEMVGKGSLKPGDLTAFYFDGPVRPITMEEQQRIYALNDKIIQRAYEIHDLGGSTEDVEKSMAHIPEEFWPPQFIDDLQAWRKVEREMAEVRVGEMFAGNESMDLVSCLNAFAGGVQITGDLAGILSGFSDLTKDVGGLEGESKPEGFLEGLKINGQDLGPTVIMGLKDLKDLMKPSNPFVKAAQAHDFSSLTPEQIELAVGRLSNIAASLKTVSELSNIPAVKDLCPFLSAISSGIDFHLALKELKEAAHKKGMASDMLKKAELDLFSGKSTDKAMVNALINERNARVRNLTKKGVESTAKGMAFAGDVTTSIGTVAAHGAPAVMAAGHGIKVLGKTIELGNKVVFAGIDWGLAKKAMKILKEAQAGNPQARLEIMKDCGLYAKMYICVMAREKNKIATQFIVDRGMTEPDVMARGNALKVLSLALMKDTAQGDERKNTNFMGVLTEAVTNSDTRKAGRVMGQWGKEKAEKREAKKRERKAEDHPYKEGMPVAETPPMDTADWERVKKDAVDNYGLFDEKTGIGGALKKIPALLQLADQGMKDQKLQPANRRDRLLKAMETLENASQVIFKFAPTKNDGDTHAEMTEYASNLRSVVMTKHNELNKLLYDPLVNAKKADWKPAKPASLMPSDWDENWKSIKADCMVTDDGGIKSALAAVDKATNSSDRNAPSQQKQRAANETLRDRLAELAAAVNICRDGVGEFPQVVAYLDDMLDKVITFSQRVNEALLVGDWPNSPKKKGTMPSQKFEATTVLKVLSDAKTAGFIDKGASDLVKTISHYEKEKASFDKIDQNDVKKRAKARHDLVKSLAEVARASDKVAASSRDMHRDIAEYLKELKKVAQDKCQEERDSLSAITFPIGDAQLLEGNWNNIYSRAVGDGAVPENKEVRDELAKSLKAFQAALNTFGKADLRTPKKLKAAGALKITLDKVEHSITRVENTPGYENKSMTDYLIALRKSVATQRSEATFKSTLEGTAVRDDEIALPSDGTFHWSNDSWQKVKKQATKLGVILDKTTGFGRALESSQKSYESWNGGEAKKKAKLANQAYTDLEVTKATAGKIKTKNVKLVAYLGLFNTEYERRKKALVAMPTT